MFKPQNLWSGENEIINVCMCVCLWECQRRCHGGLEACETAKSCQTGWRLYNFTSLERERKTSKDICKESYSVRSPCATDLGLNYCTIPPSNALEESFNHLALISLVYISDTHYAVCTPVFADNVWPRTCACTWLLFLSGLQCQPCFSGLSFQQPAWFQR